MEFNKIRFFALRCRYMEDFIKSKECEESIEKGIYKDMVKHFHGKKRIYTNDDLYFIASFYNRKTDFIKENPSVYDVAKRRGLINDLCKHMEKYFHENITIEEAIKVAQKYDSRMGLKNSKEDSWAYYYGVRNKCLDEICKHMDVVGNKYYRCIYAYEINETKTCYVGLTYSLHNRHLQHLDTKCYSAINEYCLINGYKLPEPIQKTEYLPKDKASEMERYYVKFYKEKGWNVLNKQKAGNLGGSKDNITYTLELCKELAAPYKNIISFVKDYSTAYKYIRIYGWKKEVFAHINREDVKKQALLKRKSNFVSRAKKVCLYDLEGNLKSKFNSVAEASRETGISETSIYNMCNHKVKFKFFNEQVFLFDGEEFDHKLKEKIAYNKKAFYNNLKNILGHKIAKIIDGKIVAIFDDKHLAAKNVNRSYRSISEACQKGRKCGGFYWKMIDLNNNTEE